MKHFILITDGAAGLPLPHRDNKTCLELAATPNLDALARQGRLGLARTVPPGMEASSACACMSVLGYDPTVYYKGRAGIEARSLGIPIGEGEVVFRCNLVTVRDGKMADYSAGHISTEEAREIIATLNEKLGDDRAHFYPGVGYRHILKLAGGEETLKAVCTPPHDIPGQPVADYLPKGAGAGRLLDLMTRSEDVLRGHKINEARLSRGDAPVTTGWLFWGSGAAPVMPPFPLSAALTSGVDLLRGLALMMGMKVLEIPGVTDGPDNDYAAQAAGAIDALDEYDLVVAHVEAPDEAAHEGLADEKIKAIEAIDKDMVSRLRDYGRENIRVLVMPDHPTPVSLRTHSPEPVPFLLWGAGITSNGAKRFTESEAAGTGLVVDPGYKIRDELLVK